MVTVKLGGPLRSYLHRDLIVLERPSIRAKELLAYLSAQAKDDSISTSLVCVNGVEISALDGAETEITDGDEVVVLPIAHGG